MYDPIFLPSGSRSKRRYSNKSKGRLSGEGPVTTASHPDPFILGYESGLERQVRAMFLVRPDVIDIIDQPFEILAVDDEGKPCTKIPDFWIKYVDGSSSAIEVKPMSRVKALEFEQDLEFFSQFLQPDQADEIILVTDESFERWEAINAERLLEMRREPDEQADVAIENLAACMTAPTTIGHLVDQANLGGRAFPAIFRAIYSGVLRQIEDGTINLTTIVEKGTIQ
ncbi:TnsA endonuclease N-terminal domain-containing protein [Ascidiaceihabitans sp.]|uniref:TnsA endonuclease N-terminal domain-containing protein n=1 Tax=Ascidiaceihabitans sp. TaxID=1872644 RepID=UPI003296C4AD